MLVRKVDIEFKVTHYYQMVPQLAAVFVRISLIRKECLHGCYNAVSAGRALLTVFNGETVVDHLLYISAVLGEHKPFEMICICEHRIQLWRHRLPARADSGR